MKILKSFTTGSRAYGLPTPDSDHDIVILVSPDGADAFDVSESEHKSGSFSRHVNNVNFIICLNTLVGKTAFECWETGTIELIARAPVTREEAVEVFQRLRKLSDLAELTYGDAQ